jgi:hypothetical protein
VYGLPITPPDAARLAAASVPVRRSAEHCMTSIGKNTVDEMETALSLYLSGVKRSQR